MEQKRRIDIHKRTDSLFYCFTSALPNLAAFSLPHVGFYVFYFSFPAPPPPPLFFKECFHFHIQGGDTCPAS